MNEFDYMERDNEEIHFDDPEFFNKHYIRIRDDNAIIRGLSDAFEQPQDGDILINAEGGHQFRFIINGIPTEENPPLRTDDGIPLYWWDGEQANHRTDADIQADRDALPIPVPPINPMEIASIAFVALAQAEKINDCTIARHAQLFPEWNEGWTGDRGALVREGDELFRAIHPVQDASQNTRPSENPGMWLRVSVAENGFSVWIPIIPGVNEPHNRGDRVMHNGILWESTIYGNVWEPGVFGWNEVR